MGHEACPAFFSGHCCVEKIIFDFLNQLFLRDIVILENVLSAQGYFLNRSDNSVLLEVSTLSLTTLSVSLLEAWAVIDDIQRGKSGGLKHLG